MKIGNMGNNRGKPIFLGIFLTWVVAISISLIGSDVYASAIQHHEPAVIFAASCSTCHGAKGLGGVTFVKDGVGDNRTAPQIAGKPARYIKAKVRSGSKNAAMPAFGKEEITDAELNALANWLAAADSTGVDAPVIPSGSAVRLDILDADPWFLKDTGSAMSLGPSTSNDDRRVVLGTGKYLKVVNTGRTWHTLTNSKKLRDSGFIGYAGNYRETPGDLGDIGYYYAEQAADASDTESGLAYGCTKYWCKMHPYMAVEVCGNGKVPAALSRASKDPIGNPSTAGAVGSEVWVTVQSQEEANELHTVDVGFYSPNSTGDPFGVGNDFDGVYQVIHAGSADGPAWTTVDYIPNVGNNPHNAWPGSDGSKDVVISANWHDNTVDLMDVATKRLIMEKRSGMTNAHVMVTPGNVEDFYVTHMGGRAVQRLDVNQFELGLDPNISQTTMSGDGMILGATGPHGLWMCDEQADGSDPGTDDDNYILTADTFAGGATIYDVQNKTSKSTGSGGSAPLAPSIMSGFNDTSRSDDGTGCARGFTNNALTTDVSIYDLAIGSSLGITRKPQNQADVKAPGVDYNQAGNINLKDLTPDSTTCPEILGDSIGDEDGTCEETEICGTAVNVGNGAVCTDPVRWAALPIQTPVSPSDSTHPRYMVTANKASFNVSVTRLGDGKPRGSDTTICTTTTCPEDGMPKALYTFPAGLGAHGVTYGPKLTCSVDWNGTNGISDEKCYYAYVTNTFEGGRNGGADAGYVSVYDLEKIATSSMGAPGSAFGITVAITNDSTTVDNDDGICDPGEQAAGNCYEQSTASTPNGTCSSAEQSATPNQCAEIVYIVTPTIISGSETVYVEGAAASVVINDLVAEGPDIGVVDSSCNLNIAGTTGPGNGTADIVELAICLGLTNAADMDGDGVGPDLRAPVTALCPDCRSGVHVGDVKLKDAPNLVKVEVNAAPLGNNDGTCETGESCASADKTEYTYYKADVFVDDVNSLIVTSTGPVLTGAKIGLGGSINMVVPDLDLDLQINTGGQGIVGYTPTGTVPWP